MTRDPGFRLAGIPVIGTNAVMASQFSSNDYYTNKGFSTYHGMLVTLHKNAGYGLQFDLNYTWSHSIDNFSLIAMASRITSASLSAMQPGPASAAEIRISI